MANAKKTQKAKRSKTLIWVIAVGLGIILGCIGIWYLTKNTTLYTPDKQQIRHQVQLAMDDADFMGDVAYSEFADQGCDSRNSVGIATNVHCDFLAQKYFRSSGNLAVHLQGADKVLTEAGWQRDGEPDRYDEVFSGQGRKQLIYQRDGHRIELGFYRDASWNSLYDIKKLLDEGRIPPLKDGEFLYGVRAYTSYWSCRSDSIFKQPCPSPPSKPAY